MPLNPAPGGPLAPRLEGDLAATRVAAFVGLWYTRRLGGYSGDAMGAAVELGELLARFFGAPQSRT